MSLKWKDDLIRGLTKFFFGKSVKSLYLLKLGRVSPALEMKQAENEVLMLVKERQPLSHWLMSSK